MMGSGGGSDYLDDLAASGGVTTGEAAIIDLLKEQQPKWEQDPSRTIPGQGSDPQELWRVLYHGRTMVDEGTVSLTPDEIKQNIREGEPFDLIGGGILPADKALLFMPPMRE